MEMLSGGVSRRVADLEGDVTEGEALAVSQRLHREVGAGLVAVGDHRAGGCGQLEVSGQEVGVEVGLDHALDAQPVGPGVGEVPADVALRIDHHRPPGGGVTDEVAVERKAGEVVLAEVHGAHASFVNIFWTSASS